MTAPLDHLRAALADRYALEHELGAGGMATVYLAHDVRHNRKVAVKVLRPELAAILGAERFLKEIEVTANLQHPHILPLHDSGEADAFLFYVMPYVEGESLREKLNRERQIGVSEAVKIAEGVASALDYAHRQGVIHRDIKPENILLHDGQPIVADFGIALAVTAAGGTRLTETGLSLGTPQYMSPEQATGEHELTPHSDVYSLAAVVYEMLVGEPPHTGNTVQAILAKVVSVEPQPISAVRHSVPGNIEAAVQCALAKVPVDRFGRAAEFAAALSNPAYRIPAAVDARTSQRSMGLWNRLSITTTVVAVMGIGAAAWGWLHDGEAPRLMFSSIVFPEDQRLTPDIGRDVAIAPDGSRLVYPGESEDGGAQLFLRPLDQLRGTAIPGTDGAAGPFFSPDGQSVGFTVRGTLRAVDLAGGPPITLTDSALVGTWADDESVYFMPPDGTIRRISVGGSDPETVDTTTPRTLYLDVLPGGKGALLLDGEDIAVLDFETGETRGLFPGTSPRYVDTGHILYLHDGGTLFAVPFDKRRLTITGDAVALFDGVATGLNGWGKFAVSNTGTLVYQSAASAASSIVLVKRDGSRRIVHFDQLAWDLKLSPDGTRAAVGASRSGSQQGSGGIWIVDLERDLRSRLVTSGGYPEWTPDARRVAFFDTRDGEQDFYWKPVDGSADAEVVFPRVGMQNELSFSNDGRYVIYREGDVSFGEDTDLYYLDTSTGEHRTLLRTPFMERSPRLSPDGTLLAYVTNATGRDEVWVRAFPGPGGEWQISTEGGSEPLWAHDGEELFYRTSLALVSVEVPSPFSPGRQTTLFRTDAFRGQAHHTTYDVMPDDDTFAFLKQDAQREVIIVQHFFEELQRKAGNEP